MWGRLSSLPCRQNEAHPSPAYYLVEDDMLRVPLLCSLGKAWWLLVQASTKIKSRVIDCLFGRFGPEIEMVARRTTFEALKGVPAEVRRKRAGFPGIRGTMKRADAADLVASPRHDDKPQKTQHFGHGERRSNLAEVDARHGGLQQEQRRGTRNSSSYRGHS